MIFNYTFNNGFGKDNGKVNTGLLHIYSQEKESK